MIKFSTIWHIHRTDADTRTGGGHKSCFRIWLLTISKITDGVFKTDSAQNRYTIPLTLTMVHGFISHRSKSLSRKCILGHFGFLHADDIWLNIK